VETATKKHLPNKVRRRKARQEAKEATLERGEVRAIARFVKAAPQKLRLITDAIRGKHVDEALKVLNFTPNKSARIVKKVLESVIANAENNHEMDYDDLYVFRAYVDNGPMIKRFMSKAMGRATTIRRRTSHITVVLKERGEVE